MGFRDAAEKFDQARRNLMLPHPDGEEQSLLHAFHECSHGLDEIDRSRLEGNAADWVEELEAFMDTSGLEDPDDKGLWLVKARHLDTDDRIKVSSLIDELADWFQRRAQEG